MKNNSQAKTLKDFKKREKVQRRFVGMYMDDDDLEIFDTKARRFTQGNRSALLRIMLNEWEPNLDDSENEEEW